MLNLSKIEIQSARLKLLPVSEKFAQNIFLEFTSEVTTYMFPKSPDKIDETLEFIKTSQMQLQKGIALNVSIFSLTSGEFLGGGGINHLDTDTPELGIWIKKSAQGNKYGLEAMQALKNWLDKNQTYKYIKYPVDKRNVASRKMAEELGGIVKAEYEKENMAGNVLDEVEYRIYPK